MTDAHQARRHAPGVKPTIPSSLTMSAILATGSSSLVVAEEEGQERATEPPPPPLPPPSPSDVAAGRPSSIVRPLRHRRRRRPRALLPSPPLCHPRRWGRWFGPDLRLHGLCRITDDAVAAESAEGFRVRPQLADHTRSLCLRWSGDTREGAVTLWLLQSRGATQQGR